MIRVTFRQANKQDINSVRHLFNASIKAISKEHYSEAEKLEWAKTTENLTRWEEAIRNQYFLLAFDAEELVGFISLEDNAYIDFIYVHPRVLGQGIAKALYHKIEEQAIQQHTSELNSHVSKAALGFFQKNGFQVLQENLNERNGEILVNYSVVKKL